MSDDLYSSYQVFIELFPDREACLQHLINIRWIEDFVCPRCGQQRGYFLAKRKLYECIACRFQASATSGTIFHNSHIDLHKWYWLIFHLVVYRKRFSIKYIQENLLIRTYKTAWSMAQKVKRALSIIDERSEISGFVKFKLENSPNQAYSADGKFNHGIEFLFGLVSCCNRNDQPGTLFIRMAIIPNSFEDSLKYTIEEIEDYIEIEGMDINIILDEVEVNGWTSFPDNRMIEGYSLSEISICNLTDDIDYLNAVETIFNSFEDIISSHNIDTVDRNRNDFIASLLDQFNFNMFNIKIFDQLIREST